MRSEEPKDYAMLPGLLYYFLTCHITVNKDTAQNKIYIINLFILQYIVYTLRSEGS